MGAQEAGLIVEGTRKKIKMPSSKLDDYVVIETVGTGSYGTCKKIKRICDGKVDPQGGSQSNAIYFHSSFLDLPVIQDYLTMNYH